MNLLVVDDSRAIRTLVAASDVVTISLGVAELSEAENIEGLLQKADERLYHAKENGRNQVYMGD